MQDFDIVRRTELVETYRVRAVMDRFDLVPENLEQRFQGQLDLPDTWNIGLIVGRSGTGKTTIARELFPDAFMYGYAYKEPSLLDDMPPGKSVSEIVGMFNAVGFNAPPCWVKPYAVLSNGEKMRVDLARALLMENEITVFDEFTSVVDRQVAQIASHTVQKAVRKMNRKFIAVSCHFDITEWLQPDWIFNTDTMSSVVPQKKNDCRRTDPPSGSGFMKSGTAAKKPISGVCLVDTTI